MKRNNEYKAILVGDTSAQKTAIFKKLTSGTFTDKNISTIGVDRKILHFKDIEINIKGEYQKEDFDIILYDTAGQERYRSITKSYYRNSDIIFIIYNICYRKTFDDVEIWLESINENLSSWKTEHYLITLLGNNIKDDIDKREVEEEEAKQFCEYKGIMWGGEICIKNYSAEQSTEILLNSWKAYVKKFGLKDEISSTTKIECSKWTRKKKKKKIADVCGNV